MSLNVCFAAVPHSTSTQHRVRINISRPSARPLQCSILPIEQSASLVTGTLNYRPSSSSWDYHFLQSLTADPLGDMYETRHSKLKEQLRHQIVGEIELAPQLELINIVQRLGLGYHFHVEIKKVLGSMSVEDACEVLKEDLYTTSLLFRLFRQHGLEISQDVFNSFKDSQSGFQISVNGEYEIALSLYETSHLCFQGEEILDEARDFTTRHLTYLKHTSEPHIIKEVEHSLDLPLHWRAERLEALWYIEHYENHQAMDPNLLELSKLDYNKVQSVHRKELGRMSRWWKVLGLGDGLSFFARDRLVECFFFASGIVSDPNLGLCREGITQACTLITVLDDIYDNYGSLDELELFTSAVNGWDNSLTYKLPHFMKLCYSALYNTVIGMLQDISKDEGRDSSPSLKNAWIDLCNSFLLEAKWKHQSYTPTHEEYVSNGWMSVAGPVMLSHALTLSRQGASEESLKCLRSYPSLIRAPSTILRLCNDLATSTAELERGDIPTSLQCYMDKYFVSEAEGRRGVNNLIMEEWKKLNKESINCRSFPQHFKKAAVDLARITHCMYQNCDGLGVPDQEKENQIKSLFFEPI